MFKKREVTIEWENLLTRDPRNFFSLLHTVCVKFKIMVLMCHSHACDRLANTHKVFFGTSEWETSRDRYRRTCDSGNSFLLSGLLYLLIAGAEGYSCADHTL